MIVGDSPEIRRALYLAERFARTKEPVLLVGARGTGKELLADYIHHASGRRGGTFVPVNCSAIPPGLAESLLFGHERGAFTDARASHIGWLEESDGGTLFLDEFADLAVECQAKVLRAFDSGEIRRVGSRDARRVDLRIVAAVQEDVWARVAAGTLRADLIDRVAVGVIHLPPLRVRGADLEKLATYFASLEKRMLEPGVVEVLSNYSWPGNVRELRTVIARAGCLVNNGTLPPRAVAEAIEMGAAPAGEPRRRRSRARAQLPRTTAGWVTLARANGWNAARMASATGVCRTTLFAELRHQGRSLTTLPEFTSSPGVHTPV